MRAVAVSILILAVHYLVKLCDTGDVVHLSGSEGMASGVAIHGVHKSLSVLTILADGYHAVSPRCLVMMSLKAKLSGQSLSLHTQSNDGLSTLGYQSAHLTYVGIPKLATAVAQHVH